MTTTAVRGPGLSTGGSAHGLSGCIAGSMMSSTGSGSIMSIGVSVVNSRTSVVRTISVGSPRVFSSVVMAEWSSYVADEAYCGEVTGR